MLFLGCNSAWFQASVKKRRNPGFSAFSYRILNGYFPESYSFWPWQCLYFLPLPQGQGSLRPTFFSTWIGAGLLLSPCPAAAAASIREVCIRDMSVLGGATGCCGAAASGFSRTGMNALNSVERISRFTFSSILLKRLNDSNL